MIQKNVKEEELVYCYLREEESKTQEMADDLPKVTQEVDKRSKTKFIQVSVVCIKITEPPKSIDYEQCDLGIPPATYIEVSSPRGTVTKMISKQWAESVWFF